MAKVSKNFDDSEFQCPCGCGRKDISPVLVKHLQNLRDTIGIPINITSGVRCEAYNKQIGGYKDSPHIRGQAADIQAKGYSPVSLALKAKFIEGIRIGIYPNHTHIDVIPPNPSRFWIVKKYGKPPIYSKNETNLIKFTRDNT